MRMPLRASLSPSMEPQKKAVMNIGKKDWDVDRYVLQGVSVGIW